MTALPSGRNRVRIIAGKWRSRIVKFPAAAALRPTPDRVRETLFNWLGQRLDDLACLDLFAGSGALGFEAASRGAASVLLCEQDSALVAQLQALKTKMEAEAVRIERGNGVTALERAAPGSLHAVFLDPPFENTALYEPALRAAAHAPRPEGVVYLEAARRWADEELAAFGLGVFRYLKAGAVHAHLLILATDSTA